MTQFWVGSLRHCFHMRLIYCVLQFSFFNNFSGQIAYESWTLSLYNVVFTLLPPLVIGIFDQFVSARILDRYPQLYMLGQRNAFFTRTQFWLWVGNALYHSIVGSCPSQLILALTSSSQVLFGFSVILFWGDLKEATGLDSGHWFWGLTLYLAVLLTVLGKAALVSEYVTLVLIHNGPLPNAVSFSLWTKYTVAGESVRSRSRRAITHYYPHSYPRFLRLHHGVPSTVRGCCPCHRILNRVPWHRSPIVDRRRFLLRSYIGPNHLLDAGFRMEIVSTKPAWPPHKLTNTRD